MLTIKDWDSLTNFKEDQERKYIKQARTKGLTAAGVILLIVIFTFSLGLTRDYPLAIALTVLAGIQNLFAFKAKSIQTINAAYYILMFGYLGLFWYNVHTVMQGHLISLLYFATLIVVFHRDLESTTKIKMLIFSAFCMTLMLSIPLETIQKIHLSIWMVFMAAYSYSNIDVNRRILSLESQQASFFLFQRHTRLLEHKTVNSLTRMNYHTLMMKELGTDNIDVLEHLEKIESEIQKINQHIKNTEVKDLKTFQV